ncbi:LEA_2 domain-containing protein [Cephalotus follicularis]|uniref:LEA_2 domain-containing protein n=1 Tax=Cephalotus follicularis TaxID=3775 RepID=A0A1Q3CUG6_CEPFO|nr:LEA_2 domain-containing protein [Cephalotus follicularis]
MTETKEEIVDTRERKLDKERRGRRRCLIVVAAIILLLVLLFFIIALILALTVFKPKQPTTQILSSTVEGVAPRVSFPAINIQLNITLNLQLLVHNPNHARFKHGPGKSLLLYQGNQVGEADLFPGLIPAMGNATLPCRLTLEVDKMASNVSSLISDVSDGDLVMETQTRIPGRITLLRIFKKHVIATSTCQLTIAVPAMNVQKQECKGTTKL